jgi:hypothetical protein
MSDDYNLPEDPPGMRYENGEWRSEDSSDKIYVWPE